MTKPTPSPTTASERLHVVDIIRGFAVFGIFVFNMTSFAGYAYALQGHETALNRGLMLLIRFLVEAKFYSLFSFLFGWGMAVQLLRAETRGTNFLSVYRRRLLILLAFGAIHGILFWTGDILTTYALLGFLLILFRKRSERVLLVGIVLALVYALVINLPPLEGFRAWYAELTSFARWNFNSGVYATGTFAEITQQRLQGYLGQHLNTIYFFGQVFAMLLLGLYVGKRRILENLGSEENQEWLKQIWRAGLFWGFLFSGLYAAASLWSYQNQWPAGVSPEWQRYIAVFFRTLGAPLLMLFYLTTIIYLYNSPTWRPRLDKLAPVGRMALSNYLLQSTVATLIFYNYGLGLYGEIGPIFGLILVFIIYSLQMRLSKWWLDHYTMGPAEWLWRWLSYGQRPRFRLASDHSTAPPMLRLRQWAKQNQSSLVWGVVLLAGVGLLYWVIIVRPTQNVVTAEVAGISLPPTATPIVVATPIPAQATPEPLIIPPQLEPVVYNPGPLAQQGDLLGLAAAYDVTVTLHHIEQLAAPQFAGRKAGTDTGHAAGDYIAEQFAAAGLQPAGDNGTYFQGFPLYSVQLDRVPQVTITSPDGVVHDDYELYSDYTPLVFRYAGAGAAAGEIIWVNQCHSDDFAQINVVDKIVLCQPEFSFQATRAALEHGAAALLLLLDPANPMDRGLPFQEPWVPDELVLPTLRITTEMANDLLRGSGRTATDLSLISTPFVTGGSLNLEVNIASVCGLATCEGRNVLGVLPGRDPEYADEIVIIGAHYDHMGQAPNGVTWSGANDNASGTATLLAIAQSWQAQGYVPRRTVLFVAWDGEEAGLLGAYHYIRYPRFPLENTIANLNLDMVGGPGDLLSIDGDGSLAQRLQAAANSLGVATEISEIGRSDHVPFREAGIPASLIIWFGDEVNATYHRPADLLEAIDQDNLQVTGQIAILTLFGLAEAEASIDATLQQRAEAIEAGDLTTFLATSAPDQVVTDRVWFNEVQSFDPISVTVSARDVFVTATGIEATVSYRVAYPGADGSALLTASVNGLFTPGGGNWLWSGANLRPQDEVAGGFAAAYPASQLETIPNLETYLDNTYAAIAEQLGQPTSTRATVYLYPDAPSLRADTSLALPDNVAAWVGPGTIKLVYTSNLTQTNALQTALTQLVLAEAGLSEAEVPWLWQGLPLALPFREDTIAAQRVYLPAARSFLLSTETEASADTNWLPVEYVRQQVGWSGVAELITLAGQDGVDAGLQEVLNLTGNNFDARWQEFWRSRLTTAQTNLDRLLQTRMDTVLAGNLAGFLATVDSQVPLLRTEQEHWFAAAAANGLTSYNLIGTPIALLDNGNMLAELSVVYETSELGNGNLNQEVLLTVQGSTLRWADVPFQTLSEPGVIIYYQDGQALQAQNLLTRTLSLNSQLVDLLPVTVVPTITLKLYADAGAFRHSLMPGLAELAGVSAWSANGEALKLRLGLTLPADDQLAQHLVRYQLSQFGVTDEWLLQGTALYYRERLPGITGPTAAAAVPAMLSALSRDQLFPFVDLPPEYVMSTDERKVTTPQAWDGIRYLVYTYGEERLANLLRAQAGGLDLNAALTSALGQSLTEFQASWAESVLQAHIQNEWTGVAQGFEGEQALAHITALTQPELAGRVAGSEGAAAAADYIAAQFAAYGLEPAGTDGYFQPFTVPYATLAAAPRLAIVTASGSFVEDFVYQEEFLLTLGEVAVGGAAAGELVYVPDLSLSDLDLSGKIAVSPTGDDLVWLMQQAYERGASALILVTNLSRDEDYLAKQALAAATPPTQTVPLMLLTQAGYDHLLSVTGLSRGVISASPAALPMGGVWVSLDIPLSPIVQAETANVLALLPGSDPVLRDEFIVISAHYDHVGNEPDTWLCNGQVVTDERVGDTACEQIAGLVYAGANDNASGVAVMLEMARLWQETGYRPTRSILFIA
ncbi:MAG: M28 family peptidase [Chloroflexi bacterium]|nr:M28 family peptidase [Chloroflexota bacterium]